MTGLAILGSTGSIGTQTLELVRRHRDKFRVVALTAMNNAELLARQAAEFRPDFVGMGSEAAAQRYTELTGVIPCSGESAITEACRCEGVDTAVIAVVGIAGLPAVVECIKLGRRIALANKEALVTGGEIINAMLAARNMQIFPVDSEHSAVFQCLQGHTGARRIILTASGGPFRGRSWAEMEGITPAQALKHPKWNMGRKISIDSATMMNKGLEIIEARWLFGMPEDRIDVLVHPESIVHSMVEFEDSSVIAQLGNPDMRIPILYALTCPDRLETEVESLDLAQAMKLTFEQPDTEAFPCMRLARQALEMGGTACVTLNAANEAAVELFLREQIGFRDIPRLTEQALNNIEHIAQPNLDDIFGIDLLTRQYVLDVI